MKDNYIDTDEIYFNSLSKSAKKFFVKNKHIPFDYIDANNYFKDYYKYDSNEPFNVHYFNHNENEFKTIEINQNNFNDALYCDIYPNLSKEQFIRVLKWSFESCCEKFNVEDITLDFFTGTGNIGKKTYGLSVVDEGYIVLNYDLLTKFKYRSAYIIVDTIAHEVTHKKQEKFKNKVINANIRNLSIEEQSSVSESSNVANDLFDLVENGDITLDKKYSHKYNKYINTNSFRRFLFSFYRTNYSEIDAQNSAEGYIRNIYRNHSKKFGQSEQVFSAFDRYLNESGYVKRLNINKQKNINDINLISNKLNLLHKSSMYCADIASKNMLDMDLATSIDLYVHLNRTYVWRTKEQLNASIYLHYKNEYSNKIAKNLCNLIDIYEKKEEMIGNKQENELLYKDMIGLKNIFEEKDLQEK